MADALIEVHFGDISIEKLAEAFETRQLNQRMECWCTRQPPASILSMQHAGNRRQSCMSRSGASNFQTSLTSVKFKSTFLCGFRGKHFVWSTLINYADQFVAWNLDNDAHSSRPCSRFIYPFVTEIRVQELALIMPNVLAPFWKPLNSQIWPIGVETFQVSAFSTASFMNYSPWTVSFFTFKKTVWKNCSNTMDRS